MLPNSLGRKSYAAQVREKNLSQSAPGVKPPVPRDLMAPPARAFSTPVRQADTEETKNEPASDGDLDFALVHGSQSSIASCGTFSNGDEEEPALPTYNASEVRLSILTEFPECATRAKAQDLLINALKMGNDTHQQLIEFLLMPRIYSGSTPGNHYITEGRREQATTFLKQQFIAATIQLVLEESLMYIVEYSDSFYTVDDYYNGLLEKLERLRTGDQIKAIFRCCIGSVQVNKLLYRECLNGLTVYLPQTKNKLMDDSCFALPSGLSGIASRVETFKNNHRTQKRNEEEAVRLLANCDPTFADSQNQLTAGYQVSLKSKAKILVLEIRGNQEGIPYHYHGINADRLTELAGLASLYYTEPLTQSTMPLIALQYGNGAIYQQLIKPNVAPWLLETKNHKKLAATLYEPLLHAHGKKETSEIIERIRRLDCRGEVLRGAEKDAHQYLQHWHRKNNRLQISTQAPEDGFLNKMMTSFIRLANSTTLFSAREKEMKGFLELIEKGKIRVSDEFYNGLVELLREHPRRWLTDGSASGKVFRRPFNMIKSNPKISPLFTGMDYTQSAHDRIVELEEELHENKVELNKRKPTNFDLEQKVRALTAAQEETARLRLRDKAEAEEKAIEAENLRLMGKAEAEAKAREKAIEVENLRLMDKTETEEKFNRKDAETASLRKELDDLASSFRRFLKEEKPPVGAVTQAPSSRFFKAESKAHANPEVFENIVAITLQSFSQQTYGIIIDEHSNHNSIAALLNDLVTEIKKLIDSADIPSEDKANNMTAILQRFRQETQEMINKNENPTIITAFTTQMEQLIEQSQQGIILIKPCSNEPTSLAYG